MHFHHHLHNLSHQHILEEYMLLLKITLRPDSQTSITVVSKPSAKHKHKKMEKGHHNQFIVNQETASKVPLIHKCLQFKTHDDQF